jgi:sugar phosphate isomerase/epimerase
VSDAPLTASYFTLTGAAPGQPPRFPLAERAAAAREAGFAAMALASEEVAIARAAGASPADLRTAFDEVGIAVTDLEPLRGWDAEPGPAEAEAAMFELADALENRLAPGDGDLDVAAWIASLRTAGIEAPFAVEVLSAAARELPLAEAATRAAAGARAALAAA